jgi:hypothetical protein
MAQNEVVGKNQIVGQAVKAAPQVNLDGITFTTSDIKSGLWHAHSCTKNGKLNGSGELMLRMFVLNGDADKSLEAAKELQAVGDKLDDKAQFVLVAAKPVKDDAGVLQEIAQVIRHTRTGAELKARAAAVIALAATEREPEVIFKSEKVRQVTGRKSLAAGLLD